jgi:hypothetical protein
MRIPGGSPVALSVAQPGERAPACVRLDLGLVVAVLDRGPELDRRHRHAHLAARAGHRCRPIVDVERMHLAGVGERGVTRAPSASMSSSAKKASSLIVEMTPSRTPIQRGLSAPRRRPAATTRSSRQVGEVNSGPWLASCGRTAGGFWRPADLDQAMTKRTGPSPAGALRAQPAGTWIGNAGRRRR